MELFIEASADVNIVVTRSIIPSLPLSERIVSAIFTLQRGTAGALVQCTMMS